MNNKILSIFWGVGLIAAGGLSLAGSLGYLDFLAPVFWIPVFAAISLISFATYFITGVKHWGWLFPAGIFAALGLIIGLAELGVQRAAITAPLFIAIGLPFVVAFFLNRAKNWWALIPAGIMSFLALAMLLVDGVAEEFIGSGLLFAIGLAFLLVYLSNRARFWAALVAYILFVNGLMPLIALTPRPELGAVLFLFAVALPFLGVYIFSPQRWWAIIPAGVLLTTGIITAAGLLSDFDLPGSILRAALMAGLSATFAVVWLRHEKRWAGIAVLVTALLAAGSLFNMAGPQIYMPLVVIAAGIAILASTLLPRQA